MTAPLWYAVIFLIPTLFLFRGRWSWIIPGYNMASTAQKRRYNEQKLCRTMAWLMLTMTLGFLLCGVIGYLVMIGKAELELLDNVKLAFLLVFLLHGAFTWWYCKNKCRK